MAVPNITYYCLAAGGHIITGPQGQTQCQCKNGSLINPYTSNQCPRTINISKDCLCAGGRLVPNSNGYASCQCSNNTLINPITSQCPGTINICSECMSAGGNILPGPQGYAQCICPGTATPINPLIDSCTTATLNPLSSPIQQ
jgi:hypothetical protein